MKIKDFLRPDVGLASRRRDGHMRARSIKHITDSLRDRGADVWSERDWICFWNVTEGLNKQRLVNHLCVHRTWSDILKNTHRDIESTKLKKGTK